MRAAGVIVAFILMIAALASCQNEADLNYARYYSTGKDLYLAHCQNCHGQNGEGLGALIPPLSDSVFLKSHAHQLPCYLQNGLTDTLQVAGKSYEGQKMPASGLSPIEIAEVLTYVRNSFGNKAGLVDVGVVEKDLQQCP